MAFPLVCLLFGEVEYAMGDKRTLYLRQQANTPLSHFNILTLS